MSNKITRPYTKTGDRGTTSLPGAGRVDKHHHMVEFIGTMDELVSILGACISFLPGSVIEFKEELIKAQKNVLSVTTIIYSDKIKFEENVFKNIILDLESSIDNWLKEMEGAAFPSFILPGGTPAASLLHVARTICRRAERRLSYSCEISKMQGSGVLFAFINRLSDYLFVMARYINHVNNIKEENWSLIRC